MLMRNLVRVRAARAGCGGSRDFEEVPYNIIILPGKRVKLYG